MNNKSYSYYSVNSKGFKSYIPGTWTHTHTHTLMYATGNRVEKTAYRLGENMCIPCR
jgi:hypothetical protein